MPKTSVLLKGKLKWSLHCVSPRGLITTVRRHLGVKPTSVRITNTGEELKMNLWLIWKVSWDKRQAPSSSLGAYSQKGLRWKPSGLQTSKSTTAIRCTQCYYGGEQNRLWEQKRGAPDSGIRSREVSTKPRSKVEEERRMFQAEPDVRE